MNKTVLIPIKKHKGTVILAPMNLHDQFMNPRPFVWEQKNMFDIHSDFLGMGSGAKRRRRDRGRRNAAKTDLIQAQADATRLLAYQGKAFQFRGAASTGIGGIVSGLLGGGGNQAQQSMMEETTPADKSVPDPETFLRSLQKTGQTQPGKDNTMLYLGIGAAALVTIFLITK